MLPCSNTRHNYYKDLETNQKPNPVRTRQGRTSTEYRAQTARYLVSALKRNTDAPLKGGKPGRKIVAITTGGSPGHKRLQTPPLERRLEAYLISTKYPEAACANHLSG